MNLRWGIDGPTVQFKRRDGDAEGEGAAEIGNLNVAITTTGLGYYHAISVGPGGMRLTTVGPCQQTALDRLHVRVGEVAAMLDAARRWRP